MRRLAVAALVALAASATACNGSADDRSSGPLRWAGEPVLFTPDTLPQDRVLTGRLTNDSLERLRLQAREDLRVVDADGDRIRSAAIFSQTYGHQLFPPTREPGRISEAERARVGQLGVFAPGDTLPVTISWHEGEGTGPPAHIEYRGGTLPIPTVEG